MKKLKKPQAETLLKFELLKKLLLAVEPPQTIRWGREVVGLDERTFYNHSRCLFWGDEEFAKAYVEKWNKHIQSFDDVEADLIRTLVFNPGHAESMILNSKGGREEFLKVKPEYARRIEKARRLADYIVDVILKVQRGK